MTETPMMICGHAANAQMTTETGPVPACAICGATQIAADSIDLTGRQAKCGVSCKNVVPSDTRLAFFEYLGVGSRHATETCGTCGYHVDVHQEINPSTGRPGVTTHAFTARGAAEFDSYYCGCRGWD